jgi:hypothetical protein
MFVFRKAVLKKKENKKYKGWGRKLGRGTRFKIKLK